MDAQLLEAIRQLTAMYAGVPNAPQSWPARTIIARARLRNDAAAATARLRAMARAGILASHVIDRMNAPRNPDVGSQAIRAVRTALYALPVEE